MENPAVLRERSRVAPHTYQGVLETASPTYQSKSRRGSHLPSREYEERVLPTYKKRERRRPVTRKIEGGSYLPMKERETPTY